MSTYWTRSTIYRNQIPEEMYPFMQPIPPQFDRVLLAQIKAKGLANHHPWTQEFIDAVLAETNWEEIADPKRPVKLDPNDIGAIVRKEKPCPMCGGPKHYFQTYGNITTGLSVAFKEKCACAYHHSRWSIWGNPAIVPEKFRDVTFAGLSTSERSKLSDDDQKKAIHIVKARYDHSFLFYGDAGTGKTHFSLALMERVICEWARKLSKETDDATSDRTVFRVNTKTWCDQMLAHSRNSFEGTEVPIPDLNEALVRNLARRTPPIRVFAIFDEIDKISAAEGGLRNLFEILNCLSENGGQIIATSNHTQEEIAAKWDKKIAGPIFRRICDGQADEKRIALGLTTQGLVLSQGAEKPTT